MKCILVALLMFVTPAISLAESGQNAGDPQGVGYLARAEGTKIYVRSEGESISAKVNKDFPFVAFKGSDALLGIMSTESIESGRVHVRYLKNGKNGINGDNTGWVDLKDLERFRFDCCGDNGHCSGITAPLFKTGSYTDCFTRVVADIIEKRTAAPGKGALEQENSKLCYGDIELEKLRLQLEIEKVKLERERLKAGVK